MPGNTFSAVIAASRPSFLILGPLCVFLGIAAVHYQYGSFDILLSSLIIIAAICAHMSVNLLNEYEDYTSQLDFNTHRTFFSGGSGALPGYPAAAKSVLITGLICLSITCAIGLYFILNFSIELLLPGTVGVIIIVTYTRYINRFPILCLVTPGLAFGPLMIMGTSMVLSGQYSQTAFYASLTPFFLINNLLLLNQYPDIDADKAHGRNHFPIRFGINKSNAIFLLFLLAAIGSLIIAVFLKLLPTISLFALVGILPAFYSFSGMIKLKKRIGSQPSYLAMNVVSSSLSPLLLGILLFIS